MQSHLFGAAVRGRLRLPPVAAARVAVGAAAGSVAAAEVLALATGAVVPPPRLRFFIRGASSDTNFQVWTVQINKVSGVRGGTPWKKKNICTMA